MPQLTFAPPPTFTAPLQSISSTNRSTNAGHKSTTSNMFGNTDKTYGHLSISLPPHLVVSNIVRCTIVKTFLCHLLYARGQIPCIVTDEAILEAEGRRNKKNETSETGHVNKKIKNETK
mmetsp:Transcript_6288/g.13084  ORF Transcript_6288/g.13084 Transcript_6288/m.13084 type:complete len:119 (+) Transcript_6288:32-388(+)